MQRVHQVLVAALSTVLLVGVLATGFWYLSKRNTSRTSATPAQPVRSLAVLPLKNLSPDPAHQYFADAMTAELTSELGSIRALRVASRTSTDRFAGTHLSLREIARELEVDVFLEGSVFRSGQEVRISLQLVAAATDQVLWAGRYERPADQALSIQREVAQAVASKIQLQLTEADRRHLQAAPTLVPEAYDAYLKAKYRLTKADQSEADADAALQQAESAVRLDPGFAEAYVLAAQASQLKIFFFDGGRSSDERAFIALNRALELRPDLAEAYIVRGDLYYSHLHSFDVAKAIADYQRALEINPNSAPAHSALGAQLIHIGLHERGVQELNTALRLDPHLAAAQYRVGRGLWQANRFAEALEAYSRYNLLRFEKVAVLSYLGRQQEAWSALSQLPNEAALNLTIGGSVTYDENAVRALLLAREGRHEESHQSIVQSLAEGLQKAHFHHAAFLIAAAHAESGRKKEAVKWLRFVSETGMPNYPLFRDNPSMQRLKGDREYEWFMAGLQPRWQQIVDGIKQ